MAIRRGRNGWYVRLWSQTVGKCVELYSVEVPSWAFVCLNEYWTKGGITSWIARWVSSSGLHPTRVLPDVKHQVKTHRLP
jgi:hypothetical protein